MNALFIAGLCVFLVGQPDGAVEVGVPAPLESHSPATLRGPTAELVALLQDAFNARSGRAEPHEYWTENGRYVWLGIWQGVDALLAKGASCRAPCRDNSVLHRMADLEDPTLTCKLIVGGAEVNARDELGDTPVILAAKHGDANNVSILLDYGADAAARDERGDDAMSVAIRLGRRSVVRVLGNWAKQGSITRSLCRR